jgi:hypothetical protein
MRIAEKWDGRLPGVGYAPGDWKQRARRAEAEAAAARLMAALGRYYAERAHTAEHDLAVITRSRSWRMTAPLRALARLFKRSRR